MIEGRSGANGSALGLPPIADKIEDGIARRRREGRALARRNARGRDEGVGYGRRVVVDRVHGDGQRRRRDMGGIADPQLEHVIDVPSRLMLKHWPMPKMFHSETPPSVRSSYR